MFKKHPLSRPAVGLLLLLAALASAEDALIKPAVQKLTTAAPAILHPPVVTVAPTVAAAANTKPAFVPATAAAKPLAGAAAPTTVAPQINKLAPPPAAAAAVAPAIATTIAPLGENKVIPNVKAAPTIPPQELAAAKTLSIDEKLEQYFLPVCESVDKLKQKQFFKIQMELKQFVTKTNGKMSMCFMKQFGLDPNLTPITHSQLTTVCGSRKSTDAKSSFKAFKECANNSWDPALDKELERIIAARSNCAKNHDHSKNETAPGLGHDSHGIADEESSFISEVVNKVFDEAKSIVSKSDVQLIDLGKPAPASTVKPVASAPGTAAPVVPTKGPVVTAAPFGASGPVAAQPPQKPAGPTTAAPPSSLAGLVSNKKLLNDPATVVVFVDESNSNGTTKAPVAKVEATAKPPVATAAATTNPAAATTAAPVTTSAKPVVKIEQTVSTVVAKPADSEASKVATTAIPASTPSVAPTVAATTSSAPIKSVASTAAPATAASSTDRPVVIVITSTAAPAAAANATATAVVIKSVVANTTTTKKPDAAAASTTAKPEATPSTTGKPTTATPSAAPTAGSLAALITSTTTQAPAEGSKSTTAKPEANKGIASQKPGRATDARMHQIEHERQMALDPVGHTIKHQRYELAKQQKAQDKSAKKENQ